MGASKPTTRSNVLIRPHTPTQPNSLKKTDRMTHTNHAEEFTWPEEIGMLDSTHGSNDQNKERKAANQESCKLPESPPTTPPSQDALSAPWPTELCGYWVGKPQPNDNNHVVKPPTNEFTTGRLHTGMPKNCAAIVPAPFRKWQCMTICLMPHTRRTKARRTAKPPIATVPAIN